MTAAVPGRPAVDPAINHPTRLAVLAFLSACDEAEFATVRGSCQMSDSVLGQIASALEGIGYLTIRKGYLGKHPRTWLPLPTAGRHGASCGELFSRSSVSAWSAVARESKSGGTT